MNMGTFRFDPRGNWSTLPLPFLPALLALVLLGSCASVPQGRADGLLPQAASAAAQASSPKAAGEAVAGSKEAVAAAGAPSFAQPPAPSSTTSPARASPQPGQATGARIANEAPSTPAPRPLSASSSFGYRSIAALESLRLPGDLPCLFWNAKGRLMATALLAFPGIASTETFESAGSSALALALLARELVAKAGDPMMRANIVDLGKGSLGILIEGERVPLAALMTGCSAVMAGPAFLKDGFSAVEWQAARRRLLMVSQSKSIEGRAAADWRLGSEKGLLAADLKSARLAWESGFSKKSVQAVFIADAGTSSPRVLLAGSPAAAGPAATNAPRAFAAAARPGLAREGALAVLAEYLAERASPIPARAWSLSAEGLSIDRSLASLLPAVIPVPASTKAHDDALSRAKTRALFRLFGDGGDRMAAIDMGLDLAAGGDGSLPFLLAAAIESTDGAALAEAARTASF